MSSEIAGVLSRAADLIEPEGAWTQKVYARRADRSQCAVTDSAARMFCPNGAAKREAIFAEVDVQIVFSLVGDALMARCGKVMVPDWNDAPGRTQAEAVQLLRDAAKLAEQEAADAR